MNETVMKASGTTGPGVVVQTTLQLVCWSNSCAAAPFIETNMNSNVV
jgi:hypothetical protein